MSGKYTEHVSCDSAPLVPSGNTSLSRYGYRIDRGDVFTGGEALFACVLSGNGLVVASSDVNEKHCQGISERLRVLVHLASLYPGGKFREGSIRDADFNLRFHMKDNDRCVVVFCLPCTSGQRMKLLVREFYAAFLRRDSYAHSGNH